MQVYRKGGCLRSIDCLIEKQNSAFVLCIDVVQEMALCSNLLIVKIEEYSEASAISADREHMICPKHHGYCSKIAHFQEIRTITGKKWTKRYHFSVEKRTWFQYLYISNGKPKYAPEKKSFNNFRQALWPGYQEESSRNSKVTLRYASLVVNCTENSTWYSLTHVWRRSVRAKLQ